MAWPPRPGRATGRVCGRTGAGLVLRTFASFRSKCEDTMEANDPGLI
jgi:hypothetical protein